MYDYFFEYANFSGIVIFIAVCFGLMFVFYLLYLCLETVKKKKTSFNMTGWELIYSDKAEEEKEDGVDYGLVLYSAKYDIQGKPDHIFKKKHSSKIMPVEIKSGKIGDEPFPHYGDYLQLCAYFLIIEDVYGKKPKYGKIIYKDYMFIIRNGMRTKRDILKVLGRMRMMLKTGYEKPCESFVNCRYCLCNGTVCEFCRDYSK